MSYYPETHRDIRNNAKVVLDFYNYAIKNN